MHERGGREVIPMSDLPVTLSLIHSCFHSFYISFIHYVAPQRYAVKGLINTHTHKHRARDYGVTEWGKVQLGQYVTGREGKRRDGMWLISASSISCPITAPTRGGRGGMGKSGYVRYIYVCFFSTVWWLVHVKTSTYCDDHSTLQYTTTPNNNNQYYHTSP